ncbi:glycosyltransferase family 2 protein [Methylibium sp.]|uniref:glycosyltransferase family 2 protein n=1 Tax=Methylibium sp. TaxID=2067992 RepID=UPI003D140A25
MTQGTRVVIGIATAGRREQMPLTLAQLARQRVMPDRIVVCPANPADYDEANSFLVPCPVQVVRGPRGSSAQRNTIIAACHDADVLLFMDDDYYPAPDYVEQLAAVFSDNPDIVIATNQPVRDGATGPGIPHREAVHLLDELPSLNTTTPQVAPTYGGYGCNLAVRVKSLVEHAVLFDINLPLYGWLEDIDFSRRLALCGRVVACSALRGVHLGTKRGRTSGLRFGYSQVANPIYLLRKGSMSSTYALRHVGKNFAMNLLRALWPEQWVDRKGRLKGNLLAMRDLLQGRLDPRRILGLE